MQLLLLEDDIDLGQAVAEFLEENGFTVHWCKRIAQVTDYLLTHTPQVALLDLNLPDGDALRCLAQWRQDGKNLPCIALTARAQISDRITGLRAGADDYLSKPFDLDELLARLHALLRRVQPNYAPAGTWQLNAATRSVQTQNQSIELTAMEWTVLACLAQRPGKIYSRNEIDNALADAGLSDAQSNSLEVVISRLRRKLGANSIRTHRALGYSFHPQAGAPDKKIAELPRT